MQSKQNKSMPQIFNKDMQVDSKKPKTKLPEFNKVPQVISKKVQMKLNMVTKQLPSKLSKRHRRPIKAQ